MKWLFQYHTQVSINQNNPSNRALKIILIFSVMSIHSDGGNILILIYQSMYKHELIK